MVNSTLFDNFLSLSLKYIVQNGPPNTGRMIDKGQSPLFSEPYELNSHKYNSRCEASRGKPHAQKMSEGHSARGSQRMYK